MKSKRNNTFLIYTLLFAITASLCFSFFYRYEKSMVWTVDGSVQHYNAFLYLGSWFRTIIKTLLNEHRLIIPMWEWGIGYGADAITTLSYYTFGDPFSLVSIFTPFKYGEFGYALAIILRFYAAGFAFCLYCRKMNCQKWSSICAALMYTFCAFSLFSGVRHPYFISPMIYFPLVLLGCEKIIKKESAIPFSLAVFLSAISNYYFFYMIVLLTIVYVVIRLLSEPEYRNVKLLLDYLMRFTAFAVLGVALAAVTLLPNIVNFLGNSRMSGSYQYNALYFPANYEALLGSLVGIDEPMIWAYTGVAPLAYLGVGALFVQKQKENRWAKVYFFFTVICLLIPFAGYALNGFGYVSNRWIFAWTFIISYMFAKGAPFLLTTNNQKKCLLSIGSIIYVILCISLEKSRNEYTMVGCTFLMISLVCLWCTDYVKPFFYNKIHISKTQIQQCVVLFLTLLFVFDGAYYRYSLVERDYLKEFHDKNTADTKLKDRVFFENTETDNQFYRMDNVQSNPLISLGQSTTAMYWSLINPGIVEFMKYNSSYLTAGYSLMNLCSRAWLEPLMSTKYFVAGRDAAAQALVPFGYKEVNGGGAYLLYLSENALPLGYTYNKILLKDEFEKMSIPERQQAMLQGAVLKSKDTKLSELDRKSVEYTHYTVPYKIVCDGNAELNGNALYVKNKNATVTISLDAPTSGGELYVLLSGMSFKSRPTYDFFNNEQQNKQSAYQKARMQRDLKYWIPASRTDITAICEDASMRFQHYTEYDICSDGRTEYLFNLGYSEEDRTKITLKFSESGIYTLDNLEIIHQPMERLSSYVNNLREDMLENVEISTNRIKGTLDLNKSKLLCLSLPYSEGWTAYIDGKKANLICTNIMLSGLEVESGAHTIELTYRTPYIAHGLVISISAFIILVLLIIYARIQRRKQDEKYN